MTNVIPLFATRCESHNHPSRHELWRTEAVTHFINAEGLRVAAHGGYVWENVTTLCGREATGYIDKDTAFPDCEACKAAWSRLTGWAFPLPEVVSA